MTQDSDTEFDDAAIEAARKLFAGECTFVAGAMTAQQLPPPGLPEVAFAGRSNVGKSSLINALTGRKALARISATPGRTQQINFFDLGGRLMLADLPGFGYARTSKGKVRAWTRLVMLYLKGRATLRRVLLLIDARRGIGDGDREVMAALDQAAVNYQLVLTKGDKASTGELDGITARIATEIAKRPAAHPDILVTSARSGAGIAELRAVIAALAPPR
ncbi:MAG: ribosome biogenesis GTP-binding protein YihA/YsxC [Alphaproteobacteria bacterium]|nr:ribosome biogenesis GTP-binding protein YihA/YsxC [Alphaproteobacteria bacterium]